MISNCKTWLVIALTLSACNKPQAQNLPVQLTNSSESRYELLCQDLAEVRRAKQITRSNYCGLIIPSNDDAFTLPDWVDINPKMNIDIVKTMYFWHEFSGGTQNTQIYKDQLQDLGVISQSLLELFWPKAEDQIMAFIENGELTLQSSSFDIDEDNVDELVYRMTPISRLGGAKPPNEQDTHHLVVSSECIDFGLPGGEKLYIYYSPPAGLPLPNFAGRLTPSGLRMNGFFKWNGESFLIADYSLMRPDTQGKYSGATNVCNF